jgi:hypothetical protein
MFVIAQKFATTRAMMADGKNRPMKLFDMPATMLAALSLGLSFSTMAATHASPEYDDAVRRADKDYEAANRRCEVLGLDQRKLCQNDSAAARRAAVVEAQQRYRIPSGARPDPQATRTGSGSRATQPIR